MQLLCHRTNWGAYQFLTRVDSSLTCSTRRGVHLCDAMEDVQLTLPRTSSCWSCLLQQQQQHRRQSVAARCTWRQQASLDSTKHTNSCSSDDFVSVQKCLRRPSSRKRCEGTNDWQVLSLSRVHTIQLRWCYGLRIRVAINIVVADCSYDDSTQFVASSQWYGLVIVRTRDCGLLQTPSR